MAASTKPAAKSTPAPAKRTAQKPAAAKPEAKAKPEPKAPAQPTYREAVDFTDALKAAKSAGKGNQELTDVLRLITHLAWKTPGGKVGWADKTTQSVVDFANEVLIVEGTLLPEAMTSALSIAEKAAADKPQKDAVAVLSKVIKAHAA